jgi:protein-L-isoaspartate(D-aspartate) O-methyltransferase
MSDLAKIRTTMVDSQLRTNKVNDPAVLDAFLTVPREAFVPEALQGIAYVDEDLPLGGGRYLLEPMVLARLIQAAAIRRDDVVLEIGCATGYASAILGRLAKSVIAIDSDPALVQLAKTNLAGTRNVAVFEQKPAPGYPERAPYDVILIGGAVAEIPASILDQLAETGRLVTVIENPGGALGEAVIMQRGPSGVARRGLFEAGSHTLPGFEPVLKFAF